MFRFVVRLWGEDRLWAIQVNACRPWQLNLAVDWRSVASARMWTVGNGVPGRCEAYRLRGISLGLGPNVDWAGRLDYWRSPGKRWRLTWPLNRYNGQRYADSYPLPFVSFAMWCPGIGCGVDSNLQAKDRFQTR